MEPSKNNAQSEEDDTVALRRKRARRVSFADNEITSVHVFRRDDDSSSASEAPSDPSVVGFFRDLVSSDDDDDDQPQLDHDSDAADSFLRPIGSPSPGGSATTVDDDDDDDFHGPVSAHFIRPERLSDSGVSDDVTMDSTAFSLHYRSLARSDSGDIKTRHFSTPNSHSQGSYMEFTKEKGPHEVVPDVDSIGRDSNDMSIEGEHQRSFEYDILAPAFDAAVLAPPKDSPRRNLEGSVTSPVIQLHQIQPSDSSTKEIKEFTKDAPPTVQICRQLDFENANRGTPLRVEEDKQIVLDSNNKSDQINQNPVHGSTPLSLSARKQLFVRSSDSFRCAGNINPPLEQFGLFGLEVHVAHGATPSSVHRNISKMQTLETTPALSNLKEATDRLKARLSKYSPGFSLSNKKDCEYKQDESHQTPLGEKLFILTPDSNMFKGLVDSNAREFQSLKNICKSNQNEETVEAKINEENLNLVSAHVSCNDENPKAVETEASPTQMTHLMKVVDVDLANSTVEKGKDEILVPSPPIQEVTPQLCSLQDPPRMQDLSPKGKLDGHVVDNNYHSILQVAQSTPTKPAIEISSGKKRKGVEILSNGDNIDKIRRIEKSAEVHKNAHVDLELISEQTGSMKSERAKLGHHISNDGELVLKKFLARTNQLLPPSVDKLNLRLIGRLEDILVHQQNVKKTEILCSEIQSQLKIVDPLNVLGDKRAAETRTLLYNIAYEKAKLQLLRVKHDKLQKKVQQLSSGLQECEKIKLNFMPSLSKSGAMDTQSDDSRSQGKDQVTCKKVLEKKQELETLESKAKSLSEFLHSHCKMEGRDQTYTNTIKAVSGYLQKRMPCKSIRQNLKLWEIEDFECQDNCYKLCLNYCGYVTQRFTVNCSQCSIIISNNLNDVNIGKTFPNLDAFSAFMFVFNPHTAKQCTVRRGEAEGIGGREEAIGIGWREKACRISNVAKRVALVSSNGFISANTNWFWLWLRGVVRGGFEARKQITSSLLSNLLDVVEEVQLAQIEHRNLVDAKFYSYSENSSNIRFEVDATLFISLKHVDEDKLHFHFIIHTAFAERLDLQLTFIDFYSGGKVKVTFDIKCLKCGVYPAEVLPSEIHDPSTGKQESLASSLLDEIKTASERVTVGYSRIIRLSRCISQAVQACTIST
ncbi:hypothetical protein VNO78_22343 [Psophocarpus tetragonolobus]|uniref:Knl1 C-terminal RWD domain-containing protein n=1 Tax=Psophocarpus tetragonolobus TaxID=3891 RepID=A0AAN9SE97_PSOTE